MNHDDTMLNYLEPEFFSLQDEGETEPYLLAAAVNAEANYSYEERENESHSDR